MPDNENSTAGDGGTTADGSSRTEAGRFAPSVAARPQPYTLKGSAGLDWACRAAWPGCSGRPPTAP